MLHPSTKRLIDKLSEMTRKQRVAWSESDNGVITHDTEGYRVVLMPEPHAVLLTDALGKEIESCTPQEFADEVDAAGRPYSAFVADLYREAHRHARGAERAISTVLKGLETIDAEPESEPATVLGPDELIEDLGDDTEALPEAYPEFEGQKDMALAVASMANEVNGGVRESEPEVEAKAEEPIAPESNAQSDFEDAAIEFGEPEAVQEAETATDDALPSEAVAPEAVAEPVPATEEADAPAEAETYTPAFMTAEPPESAADDEPAAVESAPQEPAAPRHFSLSGMSSGFGLGTASRAGLPPQEPAARPVETERPARPHILIDGTVDLPDDIPMEEFSASPDTPAYAEPADAPFEFSDSAAARDAHPESAPPPIEEKTPEASPEPPEAAPADESAAAAPKVNSRFNPWN